MSRITVLNMIRRVGMIFVANALLHISDTTDVMEVLVCLGIVDEQLSILAVASRLVACNPHQRPDGFGLVEDCVHFFQGAIRCFGVEEVDDGEDKGVTIRH